MWVAGVQCFINNEDTIFMYPVRIAIGFGLGTDLGLGLGAAVFEAGGDVVAVRSRQRDILSSIVIHISIHVLSFNPNSDFRKGSLCERR